MRREEEKRAGPKRRDQERTRGRMSGSIGRSWGRGALEAQGLERSGLGAWVISAGRSLDSNRDLQCRGSPECHHPV